MRLTCSEGTRYTLLTRVKLGRHDRAIVDAVHEHLVDPLCLELVLLLKVPGDLCRRSRRREGAGQADQNDLLALYPLGEVDLHTVRAGEAVVQLDGRDLGADLNTQRRR